MYSFTEEKQDVAQCLREKGSMILEMLVAFAIISTTLVAVVSAFRSSQYAVNAADTELNVVTSLMFAFDDIAREMKVSGNFECLTAGDPCSKFRMTRAILGEEDEITYAINGDKITKNGVPLTPPTSIVMNFDVYIDSDPARILLTATAYSEEDDFGKMVTLQTTITGRYE